MELSEDHWTVELKFHETMEELESELPRPRVPLRLLAAAAVCVLLGAAWSEWSPVGTPATAAGLATAQSLPFTSTITPSGTMRVVKSEHHKVLLGDDIIYIDELAVEQDPDETPRYRAASMRYSCLLLRREGFRDLLEVLVENRAKPPETPMQIATTPRTRAKLKQELESAEPNIDEIRAERRSLIRRKVAEAKGE